MKKSIYIILFLSISNVSFSQRKYAADRYFKEFAYKKAAELYKSINEKGDNSYLVLSRLADSYYFNFEYNKAKSVYEKLMDNYKTIASPEHIFRYAQVLKTNGKIEESDKWLLKLKENGNDSRAESLEKNRGYFLEYSKKPKFYVNIHNISSNTPYSDFGGFIYDNTLYFASTRPEEMSVPKLYKWNRQPYLNIYKTDIESINNHKVLDIGKVSLVNDLSSKYHESNLIITKDGKTAYFTRDNFDGKNLKGDKNNVSHLKIYKAEKEGNNWGKVKELPFNNESYSCGHPTLSSDEQTLFFVSDMPNGFGETDIYKVSILGNDNYGKPENLGETINTEGREMFPFVKGDESLFFASDGHLGLGGLDIFESKLENNKYTSPVNLGAPINGSFDDFSFMINEENTHGFFSSNRKGGKGDDDIYSFTIQKEKIEKCYQSITGNVTNKTTKEAVHNATVKLIDSELETVIEEKKTDSLGRYSFKLECLKFNYIIVAEKIDYRVSEPKKINFLKNETEKNNVDFVLEPLIVGNQIIINPIYFDFNKSNIREDAEYELEHVVTVMNNHPDMIIKIESYTDSRGGREYNKKLSDRRAKSTRDYIISRGISFNRIESAVGYGEDQLLNNCNDKNQRKCTEEEHQKNRRSYFYIVKN